MQHFLPRIYYCRFCFMLFSILLTASKLVYSQPKQIIFKHYGVSEGFFSKEAMDIVKTSNGLIWISTNEGIARFDSKSFKFFRHNNKDSNSIAHNYCKAMQVDKRGWIWIVANQNLEVFDPATEKFRHVKINSNAEEQMLVKPVAFFYDKREDIMWVATAKGLYFSKAGSNILQSAGSITKVSTVIHVRIFSISPDAGPWVWLASDNKIIKLNTKTGISEKYVVPTIVSGRNNGGNVAIISSYLDDNKTLWLGTFTLGLFSFNTVTKMFEQYIYRDVKKEENTIVAITQTGLPTQQDLLYLSAIGWGFTTFNIKTKKFTSFNNQVYNSTLGIKGDTYGLNVFDNKLWIGSSTGLHCYDFNAQFFEKTDISSIADGANLMSIADISAERNSTGKDEKLWMFIPYKNVYVYDLLQKKVLPAPAIIQKYTALPSEVFTIYIDAANVLWISTFHYGLLGYSITSKKIIYQAQQQFYKNGEWVNSFYEDSKGNLWLCTYDGLFVMDSSRKKAVPVTTVNQLIKEQNIAKSITGITEDEYGKIWLTADNSNKKNAAIIKLDVQTNKAIIIYNEQQGQYNESAPVDLRNIVTNKRGDVFANFRGEYIARFKSNSVGKTVFTEIGLQQGLNSCYIDQLLTDNAGNIWCNNSFGIAQYKIGQNSFSNYNLASYEISHTNNPGIYISPNSGRFYVGQSNSFLTFDYSRNGGNINATNLLFNDLSIYNVSYAKKIKDGDKIILNYKQDMIRVDFALLSYTNASENTYSWILEGLEKEWNVSKNNMATYNHLMPGTYTLIVKAANSNGDWKTTPIKLYITITPPFYATWWFRLFCGLLTTAMLGWIVQRRINRIKEKYQLRNRIASDLHDEIGSTLTSINILSNVSQQALEKQPQQAKELLQQISSQSKAIQQNMSDIVWSIRPDNEKIENLIVRIREYAAQTLEPLNIDTSIDADNSLIEKTLPMQHRKDILLICKEAINNIAKHANATSVKILINSEKNKISVSVNDNGKWKGNNSGTGTKTMQERAKTLGGSLVITTTEAGTQIMLVVPIP